MKEKINLAKRAQIPISPIRQILQQVPSINEERRKQGLDDIVDLSIGQPHLEINSIVIENLKKFLDQKDLDSEFKYSNPQGDLETLKIIAELFNHYSDGLLNYSIEEVMVTNGGSQALWNVFSIFVENGAEAITFSPYFATYKGQIESLGGSLITVPTSKNNFRVDVQGLRKALSINPNVRIVILNYPNNPSGVSLKKEEAEELARVFDDYPHVAIVLDEVYRDLNFEEYVSILDINPTLKERTVVIHSGAKALAGAPGLRIGMAAAPSEWIKAMSVQQLFATAGVNKLTQKAAVFAIKSQLDDNKWLQEVRSEYKKNSELVYDILNEYGFATTAKPEGAFYVLINVQDLIGKKIPSVITIDQDGKNYELKLEEKIGRYLRDDKDIAHYFIQVAGVALVPGSGFGLDPSEGILRISCAKSTDVLEKAIRNICTAATWLKNYNNDSEEENILIFKQNNTAKLSYSMSKTDGKKLADIGMFSKTEKNVDTLEVNQNDLIFNK